MVATAQRYSELHPDVQIDWYIRSLQSFADDSIATLSTNYDLLVIDHPSIVEAASYEVFKDDGALVLYCEHLQCVKYRHPRSAEV
jgi:hypothetical protein